MALQTDAIGTRFDYVSCDGQPEAKAGWQITRVGAHVRLEQARLAAHLGSPLLEFDVGSDAWLRRSSAD
jgi:hypothetical protein